jgi:hypothetical protein
LTRRVGHGRWSSLQQEELCHGHPVQRPTGARFKLSYRDVEDLLAERGLDISYETVRRWVAKFGLAYARRLCRGKPTAQWHLDERVVRIGGKHMYRWRAVDGEGEVPDLLVQRRRDPKAAVRLVRKLLRKLGFTPATLVTDKLRSHAAAFRGLGLTARYEQPALPLSPCRRLQRLQHPAPSRLPLHPADLPSRGCGDMEGSDCRSTTGLHPAWPDRIAASLRDNAGSNDASLSACSTSGASLPYDGGRRRI